jgi:hypothetical protein
MDPYDDAFYRKREYDRIMADLNHAQIEKERIQYTNHLKLLWSCIIRVNNRLQIVDPYTYPNLVKIRDAVIALLTLFISVKLIEYSPGFLLILWIPFVILLDRSDPEDNLYKFTFYETIQNHNNEMIRLSTSTDPNIDLLLRDHIIRFNQFYVPLINSNTKFFYPNYNISYLSYLLG